MFGRTMAAIVTYAREMGNRMPIRSRLRRFASIASRFFRWFGYSQAGGLPVALKQLAKMP